MNSFISIFPCLKIISVEDMRHKKEVDIISDFDSRMRKRGYKEFFWRMFKGLTLSCFIALPIYLALVVLLAGAIKEKANGGSDTIPLILLQVAYLIAVYAFYVRHEVRELYLPPTEVADAKTILREYIKNGGWILPIVFGIVAIATEMSRLLMPHLVPNPIAFIGVLNMPLMGAIPVPILRTIVGYAVSVGGIFAMTVVARKRKN